VDAGGGTGEEGRRKRREEEGRGEERREEKRAPSRRKHAPDVVVWRPPGGRQINEVNPANLRWPLCAIPSGELEHQTLTHHPHLSNSPPGS
jgi:hypothetical protein